MSEDGVEVARIEIVRKLTEKDTIDWLSAVDSSDDPLPLVEALGMLRLAEDTLIRMHMDSDDDLIDPEEE